MSQYPYRDQQPAWIGAAVDTDARVREFIRGVYAWMFGGLAVTTAAALWVLYSPSMQRTILGSRAMFFGLLIAEFVLVMWIQMRITRMSAATAASMFLVYSLLNGLTLSVIFFAFTRAAIFQAFASAALMFGGMSVFGYVTKRSLSGMGTFLIMGAWGIVAASIVNLFIASSALNFMIGVVGVVVFAGLAAYFNQQLKTMATSPEYREHLSILGALWLYITFINLFLSLLRLFGGGDRR
jgi:FtsH-binding integral membrane protein